MKEKHMSRKITLAAICIAMFATSAIAGVCKIGTTEYDTLAAAVAAVCNGSNDATITLTADIDIMAEILVSSFPKNKTCTIDGDGHVIRQAYAGRLFRVTSNFTRFTFKDVTILGGGEAYSTVDAQVRGTFFCIHSGGASRLTLDSGCVVSNFVSYGALIGADVNNYYPNWNIVINDGAVVACNRSTVAGCIVKVERWDNATCFTINGGEIFGNSAPNGTVAYLDAFNKSRTTPIVVIRGGSIHDNTVTSTYTENGLFFCDYGPIDISMTGGEIYDNAGSVFHIRRGGGYPGRVHISGGKIFGNSGYAVYDFQTASPNSMFLSGDAIVSGNGGDGYTGLYIKNEAVSMPRAALEGDFTGFAYLFGANDYARHALDQVYGTNLASYAGAENIRQGDANHPERVLETQAETGELVWKNPNSAKIGTTEYATLAAALSAAADGATIELMRDCLMTASIVPPANKAITINGAGYRIFRSMKDPLVKATTAGGNMKFTNVELNEGYFTSRNSYTNHVDGAIVNTADGVAATVTLGTGTILSGGRGTNALVRVANGATVNLDGCVITGAVNRAVAASAGGTLGVKGATVVKDNAGGDIEVENGNILSLNGDLSGSVHVTVAGTEAHEGQQFGVRTGNWAGTENFVNGGDNSKLHVSDGGALVWCRRGFAVMFR